MPVPVPTRHTVVAALSGAAELHTLQPTGWGILRGSGADHEQHMGESRFPQVLAVQAVLRGLADVTPNCCSRPERKVHRSVQEELARVLAFAILLHLLERSG